VPTYDAFLSYSHAADGRLAPAIQGGLHRLAKPWYRLRAVRVFRDKTSLSANPALWPSIERALSESRWFAFLASPAAANSEWVRREIDWWLRNRDVASFLIVLTDGTVRWDRARADFDWDASDALPRILSGRFAEEPLWVDLSWARTVENLSLRHSQFRAAILDIASPLHGRPKDELDGDDVRQHRRARRIAGSAIAALLVLTAAAGTAAYVALQRSRESASRELAAYSTAQLQTDPEVSLRLALHALEQAETAQAEDALRQALSQSQVRLTVPLQAPAWRARYSPDGALLAAVAGHEIALIEPSSGRVLKALPTDRAIVLDLVFSLDSKRLAALGGAARVWDVASGRQLVQLEGHPATSLGVGFSPDGSLIVTRGSQAPDLHIGEYNVARVWEVATGRAVSTLHGHSSPISTARFDPSGVRVITTSADRSARIWDAVTGRQLAVLIGHREPLLDGAFTADGQSVVTLAKDLTARRWDAGSGRLMAEMGTPRPVATLAEAWERRGTIGPTGHHVLLYSRSQATVYETETGKEVSQLQDFIGTVPRVEFSDDGQLLLANDESFALIWHALTGERVSALRGLKTGINSAAFSPKAPLLVTAGKDGAVRVWDVQAGRGNMVLRGHARDVVAAVWSGDGRRAATGGNGDGVRIWDTSSGRSIAALEATGMVDSLAWSHDGHRVVIGGTGEAQVWDIGSGRSIVMPHKDGHAHRPSGPSRSAVESSLEQAGRAAQNELGKILTVSFADKDAIIVGASIGGSGARFRRWRVSDGRQLPDLESGPLREGEGVAMLRAEFGFSREAGLAWLPTGVPGISKVWNVVSGVPISELRDHVTPVMLSTMSRDGSLVALMGGRAIVEVWDAKAGVRRSRLLRPDPSLTRALEFSPDGTRLLGIDDGDPVGRVWDSASGRLIMELRGHTSTINRARFSSDGRRIVTASHDHTVKVWLAASGRLVATFRGHGAAVWDAQFDPGGTRILTASADGTARIYDCAVCVPLPELRDLARRRNPPDLSPAEARQFLH
jgi:WD40 repeat protein